MDHYISEIEKESQQLLEIADAMKEEMYEYYPKMLTEDHVPEVTKAKADSLRRATVNMSKALTQTYVISDELNARWSDIKKQKKKRRLMAAPPANAAIDLKESGSDHFARGMNIYKILLVCFLGSFFGVVVEVLWCLITNGYVESRSGLVYGPFNLLYGVGAVTLTVCLYRFRNRSSWISFLGGMLVGSVVEYVCSWGQEMIFGSRSWDYSHMPFNINGRICLLYSIFWGFLGVLWIKNIYPRIAQWILKIPDLAGKIVTWVMVVFFTINSFMTVVSVYRWTERLADKAPSNRLEEVLDERFPNERMEKIFANMEFVKEEA